MERGGRLLGTRVRGHLFAVVIVQGNWARQLIEHLPEETLFRLFTPLPLPPTTPYRYASGWAGDTPPVGSRARSGAEHARLLGCCRCARRK